jgi:CO/xanthine dehydrogenase Mo-binding subunit
VALERVAIISGDTTVSPDEWYTAGSQSIEVGGAAMRLACAEVRLLFLQHAARRLEVEAAELLVRNGVIELPGTDLRASYWELAPEVNLAREATGSAPAKSPATHSIVGRAAARRDIPAKLAGGAFVHDLELPGMLHARVVRPPAFGAALEALDEAALRSLPSVVALVRNGDFVAVAAEREEQAVKAVEAAARAARWRPAPALPEPRPVADHLRALADAPNTVHSRGTMAGAVARRFEAIYSKPYLAHASIGPSCALARFAGGRLTVWSHTQGPHVLRKQLAQVLGLDESSVDVIHRDGAGCYGHNGADDVALDAALVARACGRPVLLQWSREEELAWSPCGSAMAVKISAGVDADGRIVDWRHELWSHTHIKRPGWGEGVNLLAAWMIDPPLPVPPPKDMPLPAGGADRNAVPIYDFGRDEVLYHFAARMPLRVSALRSLGAYANVFAIESMLDEVARALKADPVEFRLRHLADARARGGRSRGESRSLGNAAARGTRPRHRFRTLQERLRLLCRGCRGRGRRETAAAPRLRRRGRRRGGQSRRPRQPDRGRHRAGGELDAEGGAALGPRRRVRAVLGGLPDPPIRRSARNRGGGDRPTGEPEPRRGRVRRGAHGRRDRQCAARCARGSRPRLAAHGGANRAGDGLTKRSENSCAPLAASAGVRRGARARRVALWRVWLVMNAPRGNRRLHAWRYDAFLRGPRLA